MTELLDRNANENPPEVKDKKWMRWAFKGCIILFFLSAIIPAIDSCPWLKERVLRQTNQLWFQMHPQCFECSVVLLLAVVLYGLYMIYKLSKGVPTGEQKKTEPIDDECYETCVEQAEFGEECDDSDAEDEEDFGSDMESDKSADKTVLTAHHGEDFEEKEDSGSECEKSAETTILTSHRGGDFEEKDDFGSELKSDKSADTTIRTTHCGGDFE